MGQTASAAAPAQDAGSGMFFGPSFTLGGEEFATMTPEAFLFGDISELNLINPTGQEQAMPSVKHTNTLRCLVNLSKESIKLVQHAEHNTPQDVFHVRFTFDSDVRCRVIVRWFAEEYMVDHEPSYRGYSAMFKEYQSPILEPGYNNVFDVVEDTVSGLTVLADDALTFTGRNGRLRFPCVIEVQADQQSLDTTSGPVSSRHSQLTYCTLERSGQSLSLKVVAQKVYVDGVEYLLREIFGIEQKEMPIGGDDGSGEDDDADDDSDEEEDVDCVICMCDPMDTMVLPCRHLCLCAGCADTLRFQSNRCPICRAPFHSTLQLRVMTKETNLPGMDEDGELEPGLSDGDGGTYRNVSLVQALRAPQGSVPSLKSTHSVLSREPTIMETQPGATTSLSQTQTQQPSQTQEASAPASASTSASTSVSVSSSALHMSAKTQPIQVQSANRAGIGFHAEDSDDGEDVSAAGAAQSKDDVGYLTVQQSESSNDHKGTVRIRVRATEVEDSDGELAVDSDE
eukprot:m.4019 g.4019  ORF g.4019 m.4019 type:complete len:512 (+) comp4393_c0_seq1:127-1662(+)